jgi:hypothetical protein
MNIGFWWIRYVYMYSVCNKRTHNQIVRKYILIPINKWYAIDKYTSIYQKTDPKHSSLFVVHDRGINYISIVIRNHWNYKTWQWCSRLKDEFWMSSFWTRKYFPFHQIPFNEAPGVFQHANVFQIKFHVL